MWHLFSWEGIIVSFVTIIVLFSFASVVDRRDTEDQPRQSIELID
jgi:hypothetical protein